MTANQSTSASSAAIAAQAMALAPGTRLSEYEVRSVLGSGGFGIVYLAWDHGLQREVALKEYMPATLASRGSDLTVSVRSDAAMTNFELGLKSFVNEARLLAQFNHPSLVKVHRFWEANNTAYMVMPYYRGRTLRHVRASMSEAPGDVACRHVLRALMSALDVLHREDVFHRDVAPDNILLCDDGTPVLLDFGAARKVIGEGRQALTSILKPHYAPLEQYADQRTMRQGPWTDLYALGATLYYFVVGEEPIAAASRALHDDQPRLSEQSIGDLSPLICEVIDWMLALKPIHRPQSVQALRDVLDGYAAVPSPAQAGSGVPYTTVAQARAVKTDVDPTEPPAEPRVPTAPSATMVITGNAAMHAAPPPSPMQPPATAPPYGGGVLNPTVINSAAAPVQPLAAPPRRNGVILLGLLCINLVAWFWFTRPTAPVLAPAGTPASGATANATASADGAAVFGAPQGAAALAKVLPSAASAASVLSEPEEIIVSVKPGRAVDIGNPALREPASVGKVEPITPPFGAAPPVALETTPRPEPGAPPPRSRTPAVQPSHAKAQGPRERCGNRNFISMSICIKSECDKDAALRNHPECVKMREIEEARRNPAY